MKVFVRGGQFFADGFSLRDSFMMEEGESRLLSYISAGGCGCALVTIRENELTAQGGALTIIKRREGAEVRPASFPLPQEATIQCDGYSVTCKGGALPEIRISGKAEKVLPLMHPLSAPALRLIEGQRQAIVEVTAHSAVGRYMALIALAEGDIRLLMQDCGEEILCAGNEITVTRRFDDLCMRTVTTRYTWRGDAFDLSRVVVCGRSYTPIREEMGRALLEAVVAKDEEGTLALLSDDITDARMIYDYFGTILSVEAPDPSAPPTAASAIIKKDGSLAISTYDFDFDPNGRIENIRCLEE